MTGSRGRLWRYNYAILMGGGYWVIVLPVAASQVVTLWMMAMASGFSQLVATQIAEMMAPILGAFLAAHSLAPEYRSGVGAVLACKPVSLHRVVTARVALSLIAALGLTGTTLFVCSIGLQPIELGPPLLASLPSLWFLSMLALTFATLFRSALAGFGVAAGIWALDLAVGYAIHPFLSLQGLRAAMDKDPLSGLWLYGKGTLVVAGTALLLLHGRLLPRVCQAAERKQVARIAAAVAAVLFAYCASGAASTVGYAYLRRGRLPMADVTWLQRQLGLYGPVPVARLFGPAFAAYVSRAPTSVSTNSPVPFRVAQLEQALRRWPNSLWADGIAFALAREQEGTNPAEAAARYLQVTDRYGSSPFAPRALIRIVRMDTAAVPDGVRLQAARRMLSEYPRSPDVEAAAVLIYDLYPRTVRAEEAARAAMAAAESGLRFRRPTWLVVAARVQAEMGRRDDAAAAARRAREAAMALQEEARSITGISEVRPHLGRIGTALQDADALLTELGGG